MLLTGAAPSVATFYPGRWQIGPLADQLAEHSKSRRRRVLGYVLWRTTYDGFGGGSSGEFAASRIHGGQLGDLGRGGRAAVSSRSGNRWGWRERLMFIAVAAQTLFALRFWQDYPAYLEFEHQAIGNLPIGCQSMS